MNLYILSWQRRDSAYRSRIVSTDWDVIFRRMGQLEADRKVDSSSVILEQTLAGEDLLTVRLIGDPE